MFKKLSIYVIMIALVLGATGCTKNSSDITDTNTVNTEESSDKNSSGTSQKKKYKNISAETKPIGVDSITIKMKDDIHPMLYCKVYKNGGDIEESNINVTFEVFDENGEFLGEKTLFTKRSLCVGDNDTISDSLGWYVDNEDKTDEILSKYKANVVSINEIDVNEAENQDRLKDIVYEIESQIDDDSYNTALTLLEMAKEEFPDSKELKLLEAQIKDKMAEVDSTNTSADKE